MLSILRLSRLKRNCSQNRNKSETASVCQKMGTDYPQGWTTEVQSAAIRETPDITLTRHGHQNITHVQYILHPKTLFWGSKYEMTEPLLGA